jgi:hypothetical protein
MAEVTSLAKPPMLEPYPSSVTKSKPKATRTIPGLGLESPSDVKSHSADPAGVSYYDQYTESVNTNIFMDEGSQDYPSVAAKKPSTGDVSPYVMIGPLYPHSNNSQSSSGFASSGAHWSAPTDGHWIGGSKLACDPEDNLYGPGRCSLKMEIAHN